MAVVSSKEFVFNQKKYFDLTVREQVCAQKDKNRHHSAYTNVDESDDYITMEELREGVHEFIDKLFANNESSSITVSN